MNRIDLKFRELKEINRKAFIPFVTFGTALNVEDTIGLVLDMEKSGADIIEIGIPFSDPLADGMVIQNAYTKAIKDGVNLSVVLNSVKKIREKSEIPIVLMVYYNIIYCKKDKEFIKLISDSGVDGLIVPDIPLEERKELQELCEDSNVYLIPLVARTSKDRIKKITENAKGFVYCVSTNGTTGERTNLDSGTKEYLEEVKNCTDIPICIGFGISSKETVKDVSKYCDGVIVGSAIVKRMNINKETALEFSKDLISGL